MALYSELPSRTINEGIHTSLFIKIKFTNILYFFKSSIAIQHDSQ